MRRVFALFVVLAVSGAAMRLVAASPPLTRAFDAANDAWERGDYIAALTGYIQVVNAPTGNAWLEPIALTTGELFVTREVTPDGRAPRFSPDNRFIAYETGLETSRRTRILRNPSAGSGQAPTLVADLPGVLHCLGGPGPDNADWAAAIDGWVESGQAPARIIAQKGTGANVTRTRPLCAYPQHAVYVGTGSTDDERNFACRP